MWSFLVAAFLVGNLISPFTRSTITQDIQVLHAQVIYRFGQEIDFEATLITEVLVEEAFIYIKAEGGNTLLGKVSLDRGQALYQHDLRQQPLRPFTRVYYWYHLKLQGGGEYTSPSFWFDYEDNRYDWQFVENGIFQVRWYNGDLTFGQKILNAAHQGLESGQRVISLPAPQPLKIFVYANEPDLQSAILLAGQPWVAGYAQPDLAAVMISARPGPEEKLELERKLPHEITHILLSQAAGLNYPRIPTWLVEGLATSAELYPNPDYERALQDAKNDGSLFSIESLCGAFPQDASQNFLAYAQSASFTRFLNQSYGTPKVQSLLQTYLSGIGCNEGMQAVLGSSLRQVENRWRQETLGINPKWMAFQNLMPYFFLLGLIVAAPFVTILYRRARPFSPRMD